MIFILFFFLFVNISLTHVYNFYVDVFIFDPFSCSKNHCMITMSWFECVCFFFLHRITNFPSKPVVSMTTSKSTKTHGKISINRKFCTGYMFRLVVHPKKDRILISFPCELFHMNIFPYFPSIFAPFFNCRHLFFLSISKYPSWEVKKKFWNNTFAIYVVRKKKL